MSDSLIRQLVRRGPLHTDIPWLPEDPGEAVEAFKLVRDGGITGVGYLPSESLGKAATAIENSVRELIAQYNATGVLPPGLRNFYAAKGVPFDTLAKLEAGELPMDAASRAARAREMGLDPDMVWSRHDLSGLDHARLQHRGGLTYAGFTPYLADEAAVSKGQLYPLIASPKIVGLQPFDGISSASFGEVATSPLYDQIRRRADEARSAAEAAKAAGLQPKLFDMSHGHLDALPRAADLAESFQSLNELASPDSLAVLRAAAEGAKTSTGPRYGWSGEYQNAAPAWKKLESQSMKDNPLSSVEEFASQAIQDRARAAGARGTLVGDEAGVSVAFMEPSELRHADLALLDPDKAGTPGYMRSALPLALAGARPSEQESQARRGEVTKFLKSITPKREGDGLGEFLSKQGDGAVMSPRHSYAAAVSDSLDRPVISTAYAAEKLGDESLAERYPNGYLSTRQFLGERAGRVERDFVNRIREYGREPTPEELNMVRGLKAGAMEAAEDAEGIIAGTLTKAPRYPNVLAGEVREAVAAHAPGGKYAKFAGRTASERKELESQYGAGEARYMLTQDGRQNHEAQRLLDLWSATGENYLPASGMAQAQRAIGGLVAPAYSAIVGNSNRLMGEQWDDMAKLSRPDGKYEYAAEMYRRGNDDAGDPASVYTAEGRPKYVSADMTSPQGLANAMALNTSYPLASWNQAVTMRGKQIPTVIGNALGGGDANFAENITGLRQSYNQFAPTVPDGADPQEYDRIGKLAQSADERMSGYNAAQLGPAVADGYNATAGKAFGNINRFYLPPVAEDLMELPVEAVTDAPNMAMNAAFPGASAAVGAAKKAATGSVKAVAARAGGDLIRSLAKVPSRMGDDLFEESTTGMGINSAVSGNPFSYFYPPKDNKMMGNEDPNAPGYDKKLDAASVQARQDQMDAARSYGEMIGRTPEEDSASRAFNRVGSEPIKKSPFPYLLLSR